MAGGFPFGAVPKAGCFPFPFPEDPERVFEESETFLFPAEAAGPVRVGFDFVEDPEVIRGFFAGGAGDPDGFLFLVPCGAGAGAAEGGLGFPDPLRGMAIQNFSQPVGTILCC